MSNYQANIIFQEDLTRSARIPFGIHTNCKLVSVESGDGYFDINFEDSEANTHNKRLWQPKGSYPRTDKDGNTETTAEAMLREERENMRHVVRLLHIFIGEDALAKVSGKSYEEFMSKAAGILNQKAETKRLNLKLIYDGLGVYSTFGSYPDYVEEYKEGEEPTIKYTPWELTNRTTKKEEVKSSKPKANPSNDLDDLLDD